MRRLTLTWWPAILAAGIVIGYAIAQQTIERVIIVNMPGTGISV